MYRRQPPRLTDTVILGGWLFADLLLALVIIFLAGSDTGIKQTEAATPTPTIIPTPTPTPTQQPQIAGVNQKSVLVQIRINNPSSPDFSAETDSIKQQVHQQLQPYGPKKVAFAFTFAGGIDPQQDTAIAHKLNLVLQNFVFDDKNIVYKEYIDLQVPYGTANIDVYFYNFMNQ